MSSETDILDFISKGPLQEPAAKLVVLCHGYGYNAAFMEKQADAILKEIPNALVIMPHAPEELSTADDTALKVPQQVTDNRESLSGRERRQWFSIDGGDLQAIHARSIAAAKKLNEFIDEKRDELGLQDTDIAMMGLSQGGNIAMNAAYLRENKVACVVGHSTLVQVSPDFNSAPPTYYIYGDNDEEFTKEFYQGVANMLKQNGYELEVTEVPGLSHKTSAESREFVAKYIKSKLNPTQPRPKFKFFL